MIVRGCVAGMILVSMAGCSKSPQSGSAASDVAVMPSPAQSVQGASGLAGQSPQFAPVSAPMIERAAPIVRPPSATASQAASDGSPAPARMSAVRVPQRSSQQIAYTYGFGFTLSSDAIAPVQARHMALCDKLGDRCHVVSMNQQAGDRRSISNGVLTFAVSAESARSFGDALVQVVGHEGGVTMLRTIQGQDLSKQIVDVEARLRGRQALADRLMVIVKTHSGSIQDLVSAENSLAAVQEEIDTANSELSDAKGRVAMSTVSVSYATNAAAASVRGFWSQVSESLSQVGMVMGASLSWIIILFAVLLPWLLLIVPGVLVSRRWIRRKSKTKAE